MSSSPVVILSIFFYSVLFNSIRTGDCAWDGDTNSNRSNSTHGTFYNSQALSECSIRYSSECFAKSITKLLKEIELGSGVQVLPGVHLMFPPQETIRKTPSENNSRSAEQEYFEKWNNYFSSMSLRIQLFHPETLDFMNSVQEKLFNLPRVEGRKKMKDSSGIMGVGLMFGGSALLMTLSALAMLAGKAIITSVIALVLSMISGLSMLKGDTKSTTYEVISKPVVSHGHSHSSEIQYEHAGPGHHGYK